MRKNMKRVLFANTRKYAIEEGSAQTQNLLMALSINRRLEAYGVTLSANALQTLSTQTAEEMARTWKDMEDVICDVMGCHHFKGELFYPNFPEEVIGKDEAELYLNALFYYAFSQTNNELMDQIADMIRDSVTENPKERLPLIERFPRTLTVINLGTEKDLFELMNARMHSLNMSESQFDELVSFSKVCPVKFDEMLKSDVPFQSKETKIKLAMLLHSQHRDAELRNLLKDSVDVLRFAAMLSKKNGVWQNNAELKPMGKEQIAFKLKPVEKTLVRDLLHDCKGLYEDIWRQEVLFKRLMNRLGTRVEDGCSKRVAQAFDNLAAHKKLGENGLPIFNPNRLIPAAIEHLNKTGDPSQLEKIAKERPGDFMRVYFASVAHTIPEYRPLTIEAIRHCSESKSIPLRALLVAKEQLEKQIAAFKNMESGTPEVKIYKHHHKYFAKANPGVSLSEKDVVAMDTAIFETAANMVKGYQNLGTVYIDPALEGVKVPGREMRDASGGSVLTPYSSIEMDPNKQLMIFGIRWEKIKGSSDSHIDVDLSAHMYREDYSNAGFCSYNRLKTPEAVHSGDWTHVGVKGSSTEAILIDKAKLKENNIRYVVAEVHSYNLDSFRQAGNCKFVFEQKEGALPKNYVPNERYVSTSWEKNYGQAVFLGEVFEPAHLENCIDLNSDANTAVPMFYDVKEDKIYWLDMGLRQYNLRVTENPYVMCSVMAEIELAKNNPFPDCKTLFECYAKHNGTLTDDITKADTVFVREHIDKDALHVKESARVITGFDLEVISKEFSGNDDQVRNEPVTKIEKVETEKIVQEPILLKQFRYLQHQLRNQEHTINFSELDHGFERN